jgi:hypothetical protein
MLDKQITAVCSEIHENQRNALHRQHVEFMNVKPRGILSIHWTSES